MIMIDALTEEINGAGPMGTGREWGRGFNLEKSVILLYSH
jgi:hypothetical protein